MRTTGPRGNISMDFLTGSVVVPRVLETRETLCPAIAKKYAYLYFTAVATEDNLSPWVLCFWYCKNLEPLRGEVSESVSLRAMSVKYKI